MSSLAIHSRATLPEPSTLHQFQLRCLFKKSAIFTNFRLMNSYTASLTELFNQQTAGLKSQIDQQNKTKLHAITAQKWISRIAQKNQGYITVPKSDPVFAFIQSAQLDVSGVTDPNFPGMIILPGMDHDASDDATRSALATYPDYKVTRESATVISETLLQAAANLSSLTSERQLVLQKQLQSLSTVINLGLNQLLSSIDTTKNILQTLSR